MVLQWGQARGTGQGPPLRSGGNAVQEGGGALMLFAIAFP